MKQKTKISVIIPTVNAHEELDLAISSIKKNSDNEVEFLIVVDPDMNTGKINQEIIKVCGYHKISPLVNKKNLGPYGNWNKGASHATSDWLIFATDDQYFAPHWDSNLLKYYRPKRLIAGRLIEPGIIPVYKTNIQKDFGVLPSEFKESEFLTWCAKRKSRGFVPDGFFIPMLQHRADYEALGGYPTEGKFGTSTAVSNDVIYVQEALKKGYEFGTADDSYSYHFQASSWKKKTLKPKIAAVVLTKNEERHLPNCLESLKWVSHVLVLDSGSTDRTVNIAKKLGAQVLERKLDNFADQRNFALEKVAGYDWVLMVDADETVEKQLAKELVSFAKDIYLDGVRIPRKNYIFGKWIQHTDWYPDYHLSFFRPKIVTYRGDVHERAHFTKGNETVANASGHLIHQNYDTVAEFIEKNFISYPQKLAQQKIKEGYSLNYQDLIEKPVQEFLQRFFQAEGYKDGVYGLLLSLLMAGSTLATYAYVWESQGKPHELTNLETQALFQKIKRKGNELSYWLATLSIEKSVGIRKLAHRARRKALKIFQGR